MESCGYRCLRHLYAMHGLENLLEDKQLDDYRNMSALSMYDLMHIVNITGLQAKAYQMTDRKIFSLRPFLPCVAHLSFNRFSHYVVIVKVGWLICYLEPSCMKRRFLPKWIFNLIFTKKVFVVDCF